MTDTVQRGALRRALVAVATVVAVIVGGLVAAAPADAETFRGSVPVGTELRGGDVVASPNGQFRLTVQSDGNVVASGIGGTVLWSTGTGRYRGATLDLQTDGNLVVYRAPGAAVWASNTAGKAVRTLDVGDDGDVSLRSATGAVLWHTSTSQDRIASGQSLLAGSTLRADGNTALRLVMQTDGNLVQYRAASAIWSSRTSGHPGASAVLQSDGNLVVVSADGAPLWSSRTNGKGVNRLIVQLDGVVALYTTTSGRAWSSAPVAALQWPVTSRRITGRYGDDRGPSHTPRYHQGADAGVGTGTPVYASSTGRVTTVVTGNGAYGNYVVVTYGITTVLTAHLSSISVKQGQVVSSGSLIARSGNTGQSTGPHVHVETRVDGRLRDPLTVLSFR